MKFIFVTDLHISGTTPSSRVDDYTEAFFTKLDYVLRYAKKKKVDFILCGGDILHTPSPSDYVVNRFLAEIVDTGIPWYSIYGNHTNKMPKERSKIGLIEHCRMWHHLEELYMDGVYILGVDFSKRIECAQSMDVSDIIDVEKYEKAKKRIIILHNMVGRKSIIIGGEYKVVGHEEFEIYPHFDIALLGHYHPGFGVVQNDNLKPITYANPGSLMRTNITDANETCGPGLVYGYIKKGVIRVLRHCVIPHNIKAFVAGATVSNVHSAELRLKFVEALKDFQIINNDSDRKTVDFRSFAESVGINISNELLVEIEGKINDAKQLNES